MKALENSLGGFAAGFFAPWRGLMILSGSRKLQRLAALPIIISAIITVAGLYFGISALAEWIPPSLHFAFELFDLDGGSIVQKAAFLFLEILAWPVGVALVLCLIFIFSRLAAGPFVSLLAEQILLERGFRSKERFRLRSWLAGAWRVGASAIGKAFVFSLAAVVLFAFSFAPGLGLFSAFGFLLLAAFDIVDVSFDALSLSFGQRWRLFCGNLPTFSGLATAIGLVFLVPGLNFLLLPASVAGTSGLVGGMLERARKPSLGRPARDPQ